MKPFIILFVQSGKGLVGGPPVGRKMENEKGHLVV